MQTECTNLKMSTQRISNKKIEAKRTHRQNEINVNGKVDPNYYEIDALSTFMVFELLKYRAINKSFLKKCFEHFYCSAVSFDWFFFQQNLVFFRAEEKIKAFFGQS